MLDPDPFVKSTDPHPIGMLRIPNTETKKKKYNSDNMESPPEESPTDDERDDVGEHESVHHFAAEGRRRGGFLFLTR